MKRRTRMMMMMTSGNTPVYYVDQTGGDDSNNGLSAATAWQTLGKVNESAIAGHLLFKRGETWTSTEQYALVLNANNLAVGAYGTGANPIIAGSPCIGAGVDVGLTTDYAGVEVNSPPDIGAFQY